MEKFNLKDERTLRTFLSRGINCGHAVLKNTASVLKTELPLFSTMVSTKDLYNNNKLFFETFEKLTELSKLAINEIEATKEVKDLQNSREELKNHIEKLYMIEHEEKGKITELAKSTAKADIELNESDIQIIRKLKRELAEKKENSKMEYEQTLRKRFEI